MKSKLPPKVLILVSTNEEYRYMKEALLANKSKIRFTTKVVNTGIGKVNAAQYAALELQNPYDLVVCSGYCGSEDYRTGQLVNPRRVVDLSAWEYSSTEVRGLKELPSEFELLSIDEYNSAIITSDKWIHSENLPQDNFESATRSFDMETFAVAAAASEVGVPCSCVKVVSNNPAVEGNEEEYNKAHEYLVHFDDVVFLIAQLVKSL